VTLRLAQDRDRIAEGMNAIMVRRLFYAGLALETALGLMGDHAGTGKVREAVGELEPALDTPGGGVADHLFAHKVSIPNDRQDHPVLAVPQPRPGSEP
jgi:hypothetical protein